MQRSVSSKGGSALSMHCKTLSMLKIRKSAVLALAWHTTTGIGYPLTFLFSASVTPVIRLLDHYSVSYWAYAFFTHSHFALERSSITSYWCSQV